MSIGSRANLPERLYWMGGGGGGGGVDPATQMQFNEQAARLSSQLSRYNIVSPYGRSTFRGQTLTETLSPRQKKLFKKRERADISLAQSAAEMAERENQYLAENRERLTALRQAELGATETRGRARSELMSRLFGTPGQEAVQESKGTQRQLERRELPSFAGTYGGAAPGSPEAKAAKKAAKVVGSKAWKKAQTADQLAQQAVPYEGATEARSAIEATRGLYDEPFDPTDTFRAQGVEDLSDDSRAALARGLGGLEGELRDLGTGAGDVDRYGYREQDLGRTAVEEALMSRLNPQFERDRGALEARLAAQGLSPGTEAYAQQMDELRRAGTDARMQAILAGGQEQTRLEALRQQELGRRAGVIGQRGGIMQTQFGAAQTDLERRRALRQQLLEEQLAQRRQPLEELATLEA